MHGNTRQYKTNQISNIQHGTTHYNTIQHDTRRVTYNAIQYNTRRDKPTRYIIACTKIQHKTIQHDTMQYNIQYNPTQNNTRQHKTIQDKQYDTKQYNTTTDLSQYTTRHSNSKQDNTTQCTINIQRNATPDNTIQHNTT